MIHDDEFRALLYKITKLHARVAAIEVEHAIIKEELAAVVAQAKEWQQKQGSVQRGPSEN